MENTVDVVLKGSVLHLQLQRPAKKNALTFAMHAALAQALLEADQNDAVRCVILSGAGGCFCAGNDLHDFLQFDFSSPWRESPVYQFMLAMVEFSKPIIAAVEGAAIGIGATLLLHCDFVYVAQNTQLQLPFVSMGLCPEFASSVLLPKRVGECLAREWLMLGTPISATEAQVAGLVHEVSVDPLQRAQEQADRLVALPAQAVAAAKSLMQAPMRSAVRLAIEDEVLLFQKALRSQEFQEAATAFFDRTAC